MQSRLNRGRYRRNPIRIGISILILACSAGTQAQQLTVEKIMRDPRWIGTSPSGAYWSRDGKYLFFSWNPEGAVSDSLYYITKDDPQPRKASWDLQESTLTTRDVRYNNARTAYVYSKQGDVYYADLRTGKEIRITNTVDGETNPSFGFHDSRIVFLRDGNFFSFDIATGATEQLTNFDHGAAPPADKKETPVAQEKWLTDEQQRLFDVLRDRKMKKDLADSINKSHPKHKELKTIYLDNKMANGLTISPDGRFVTWRLVKRPKDAKSTIVPSYVTNSGFTEDIPGRTKVGAPEASYGFWIYDREKDTVIELKTDQIPGIRDLPAYLSDYPALKADLAKKNALRGVTFSGPGWSEQGSHAVLDIRSQDNKDRWLMLLDPATGKLSLLDRQHDEAWIGGPGIGYGSGNAGWLDEDNFWFQSEATGYSHLYKVNVATGAKTQLTSGQYEVQQTTLSRDRKNFFITTNEVDPGEQQFYILPVTGGKAQRVTTMTGANQVVVSPDEKQLAIIYSYSNKPWELYLQENKPGSKARQITNKAMSDSFRTYAWRDPELIYFTAADGARVRARIYRPTADLAAKAGHPAVIFVHGAGYLQNVHKWWSSYFREYMFNNLLADKGYTVLDIDYRGSAGYGRDWRTGIYRYMGGKDLSDQVDGVRYLVASEGVNPAHVGLYGGSYGGFMTLMALFTKPDVFAAGAALRSVTDWAHYNHGYTSDILNEPFTDSIAYQRSSPINFASGLKGHLLMCHGMVDENVHFQDIVRLSQRLIELGKDNWELAAFPMEDHGFVEPSSWTDEYKRILKLFDTYLH